MQISIENINNLGRKINITIPIIKVNDLVQDKIKKLTKEVKLNGFRPGHVPAKLIQQKYGTGIREEVVGEVLESALKQALTENNLIPAGNIKLEEIVNKMSSDQDLKCQFYLEIYPEIIFNDFSDLIVKTPKVTITEEDLDNYLLLLRKEMGEKISVTRPAKMGDILTIDFNGLIDGKEFPGGSSTNQEIELGGGLFIDGFESSLIGTTSGTSKEIHLKFPNDYAEKTLSGKSVTFNVTIKQVTEKKLCEIDNEFAKKLNIEDDDVDNIRAKLLTKMEEKVNILAKKREKEQLINQLLKNYPIDLPENLVKEEENYLYSSFKNHNQSQGIFIKDLNEKITADLYARACYNVQLSLLLKEVISKYNIKIDENLLQAKLEGINSILPYCNGNEEYKKIYNNLKNSIINETLINLALEFLMTKATKEEEILSFDKLVNTNIEAN